jgi:hypothetical protein
MAKSIRSKIMKKHRAHQRKTVGEKATTKILRKTVRRMKRSLGELDEDRPTTLAALRVALATGSAAAVADATGRAVDKKKLRYTFNSALREQRLADDLEDVSDDEAADNEGTAAASAGMALADIDPMAARVAEHVLGPAAPVDEEGRPIEQAGVHMAPDKLQHKRLNYGKHDQYFRDGFVGFYESDARLEKRNKGSHRKGAARVARGGGIGGAGSGSYRK